MRSKIFSILVSITLFGTLLQGMQQGQPQDPSTGAGTSTGAVASTTANAGKGLYGDDALDNDVSGIMNQFDLGSSSSTGNKAKKKKKGKAKRRQVQDEGSSSSESEEEDPRPRRRSAQKNRRRHRQADLDDLFQTPTMRLINGVGNAMNGVGDSMAGVINNSMRAAEAVKTTTDLFGQKAGEFVANTANKFIDHEIEQQKMFGQEEARAHREIATGEHEIAADAHVEAAEIAAEANRKAHVQAAIATTQQWINFIKNRPHVIAGLATLTALGIYGAKHTAKGAYQILKELYGKPRLAQDSSLLNLREKVARFFGFNKELVLKPEDLIFNKEFKERMDKLAASISNTVENDGFFRNLLFYGIPGTGKTLAAKTIAKNSGLDYIYFAASDLGKLTEKDSLNKVTELFNYAKRSTKKLMIIIDEAEELFADRTTSDASSQMKNVLNLILSHTGTESKNYFLVLLTNMPEKLDAALLSRCDELIEFPAPNHEEIKQLLELYIKKLLPVQSAAKAGLFSRWFGKRAPKALIVEPGALDSQALDAIATKIDGFVGRDISKLVIAMRSEAFATKDLLLTKKLMDDIVDRKIAEKKKADQKFQTK